MCHNIMRRLWCFTFPFVRRFTFSFISFLLNSIPIQLTCGSIMSISIALYAMKIRPLSLEMYAPPTSKILPSSSSLATSSYRRIFCMIILFLCKAHNFFRRLRSFILPKNFLSFKKLILKGVKGNLIKLPTFLQILKIMSIGGI